MLTQISQITQNYNYAECLVSRESHEVRIVTLANCTAQTLLFPSASDLKVRRSRQLRAEQRSLCEICEIRVRNKVKPSVRFLGRAKRKHCEICVRQKQRCKKTSRFSRDLREKINCLS